MIDLEPHAYGTHSLRRTKVALVYKKTGNLRACQLLPGHRKLESTVRYLRPLEFVVRPVDQFPSSEKFSLLGGMKLRGFKSQITVEFEQTFR